MSFISLMVLCQYHGHPLWIGDFLRNTIIWGFLLFFFFFEKPAWFICQIIFMSHSDLGMKYILLSQMGFLGEYFLMRFNEDIE